MDRPNQLQGIQELISESVARINAILAVIEMGGEAISEEERARRDEQARRASPPDLMQLEDWDLMGFDVEDPPWQTRMPQEPLNKGRRLQGLPTGKRLTREEEERQIALDDLRYKQMRATGHIPADMLGPDVPEEVPDWALEEPGEFVGRAPKWPQEFYQTGGPLPPPFLVEPPQEVLEQYDPYHKEPGYQPKPTFSHLAELAPTWDPSPAYYRSQRTAAPRQFIEEFDPYNPYQQPQGHSRRVSPPFPLPTASPPGVSRHMQSPRSPPVPRPRSPSPPRTSYSPEDDLLPEMMLQEAADPNFLLSSRPQSPPRISRPMQSQRSQPAPRPRSPSPTRTSYSPEDDLLPEMMLQEAADPNFLLSSRPQSPPRPMKSPVRSHRSQSPPSRSRSQSPQPSPRPAVSGSAQQFVSEAANIVEETRRRLDRTLKSRFGEDLNEILKRARGE